MKPGNLFTEYFGACGCGFEAPANSRSREKAERELLRQGWSKMGHKLGWVCPRCIQYGRNGKPLTEKHTLPRRMKTD